MVASSACGPREGSVRADALSSRANRRAPASPLEWKLGRSERRPSVMLNDSPAALRWPAASWPAPVAALPSAEPARSPPAEARPSPAASRAAPCRALAEPSPSSALPALACESPARSRPTPLAALRRPGPSRSSWGNRPGRWSRGPRSHATCGCRVSEWGEADHGSHTRFGGDVALPTCQEIEAVRRGDRASRSGGNQDEGRLPAGADGLLDRFGVLARGARSGELVDSR